MTSTDAAPPTEEFTLSEWADEPASRGRRRRRARRRPAPKANWFWRFLFPLVVIGLGAATFLLWREGTKAVLDSTDGTLVEVVNDPNAPGFEAFAVPTPTMIVLHTDDNDGLVGVTVLARTLLDNGGQGVLLSAELAANGQDGVTLSERYAAGGADAVEADVGTLFGFGFLETATFTTRDLSQWLELVEPVAYNLLDDLEAVDAEGNSEVWLSSGGKQLDGEVAAQLYAFRNPAEADANRNERQLDLWESWLVAIAQTDDINQAVPPFDEGLSPYLRAFAQGQAIMELAPARPVDVSAEQPIYAFDDTGLAWLDATSLQMTPLPIAPIGSDLATIRLLDGTGDRRIAQAARTELARDAEIQIIGNANEFGVTTSTVSYHDEASAAAAERLATTIGGEAVFDPRPDDPVDLTVVIGTDWEAP